METRKLSLQEMEMTEGGWSWSGCTGGALRAGLMPVIATMWNPWLALGVVAVGCIGGALEN